MLDNRQFWKLSQSLLQPRLDVWRFQHDSRGDYLRPLDDIWHGFSLVPNWHGADNFYVLVGIHVPSLHESSVFLTGRDYRGFEISHRLGMCRESGDFRGTDEWYCCRDAKQLEEEIARMCGHLEAWALPWYRRFKGLIDAATEFYNLRLDDSPEKRPSGGPLPPDPFGWAMYGWMLKQLGQHDASIQWLQRAYAEVTRPLFAKNGQMVAEGTKGARRTRHATEEQKLEELLRQTLGKPIS